MKIGLFFGSFNPIHVGHLIIAQHLVEHSDLNQVWMVVTPHNPHKKKSSLARDYDRLHLVNIAIGDDSRIKSSDIEFSLPKPSYTVDTLIYLKEKYSNDEFVLIMGGDNLSTLNKWKNYEIILENHEIYVYRRPSYDLGDLQFHPTVKIVDAPLLEISSSFIRQQIKNKKSVRYLVTEPVYDYLDKTAMYENFLSKQ